jgi:PBP1b-binding outer membrane lipoprotein LpoB
MKKQFILSAIMIVTIGLLLTSCKKNEATPTETTVPTEAIVTTPADTTKTPTVVKDTLKSSEKGEKGENEKN